MQFGTVSNLVLCQRKRRAGSLCCRLPAKDRITVELIVVQQRERQEVRTIVLGEPGPPSLMQCRLPELRARVEASGVSRWCGYQEGMP